MLNPFEQKKKKGQNTQAKKQCHSNRTKRKYGNIKTIPKDFNILQNHPYSQLFNFEV
jgi:hypothetical protein